MRPVSLLLHHTIIKRRHLCFETSAVWCKQQYLAACVCKQAHSANIISVELILSYY